MNALNVSIDRAAPARGYLNGGGTIKLDKTASLTGRDFSSLLAQGARGTFEIPDLQSRWQKEIKNQTFRTFDDAVVRGARFLRDNAEVSRIEYGFEIARRADGTVFVGDVVRGTEASVYAIDSIMDYGAPRYQTLFHNHPIASQTSTFSRGDLSALFVKEPVDGWRHSYLYDAQSDRIYCVSVSAGQDYGFLSDDPTVEEQERLKQWVGSLIDSGQLRVGIVHDFGGATPQDKPDVFRIRVSANHQAPRELIVPLPRR